MVGKELVRGSDNIACSGPLVTVECGRPGERYTLLEHGPVLDVHLAGPGSTGGTGPCLCGFDRHKAKVGFSVGGGTTGPNVRHEVCPVCAHLADEPITGLHKELFANLRNSGPALTEEER